MFPIACKLTSKSPLIAPHRELALSGTQPILMLWLHKNCENGSILTVIFWKGFFCVVWPGLQSVVLGPWDYGTSKFCKFKVEWCHKEKPRHGYLYWQLLEPGGFFGLDLQRGVLRPQDYVSRNFVYQWWKFPLAKTLTSKLKFANCNLKEGMELLLPTKYVLIIKWF